MRWGIVALVASIVGGVACSCDDEGESPGEAPTAAGIDLESGGHCSLDTTQDPLSVTCETRTEAVSTVCDALGRWDVSDQPGVEAVFGCAVPGAAALIVVLTAEPLIARIGRTLGGTIVAEPVDVLSDPQSERLELVVRVVGPDGEICGEAGEQTVHTTSVFDLRRGALVEAFMTDAVGCPTPDCTTVLRFEGDEGDDRAIISGCAEPGETDFRFEWNQTSEVYELAPTVTPLLRAVLDAERFVADEGFAEAQPSAEVRARFAPPAPQPGAIQLTPLQTLGMRRNTLQPRAVGASHGGDHFFVRFAYVDPQYSDRFRGVPVYADGRPTEIMHQDLTDPIYFEAEVELIRTTIASPDCSSDPAAISHVLRVLDGELPNDPAEIVAYAACGSEAELEVGARSDVRLTALIPRDEVDGIAASIDASRMRFWM